MLNQTVLPSSQDYRDMVVTENGFALLTKDKLIFHDKNWSQTQEETYEG
jgi:hypothetical protein